MTSTGEVYLNLFGDACDPDEVSRYIGLVGATVRRKGSDAQKFHFQEYRHGRSRPGKLKMK